MKKLCVLLLALTLLCMSFAACGKKASPVSDSGTAAEQTSEKTPAASEAMSEAVSEAASISNGAFIDIYSLEHPAKEAAILLTAEMAIPPLGFDNSFLLEKDGTFTDNNGVTREFYIVNFKGEPIAIVSDYSEEDKSVLFNCIADEQYPFALYECTDTGNGWTINKESECIPGNYAAAE